MSRDFGPRGSFFLQAFVAMTLLLVGCPRRFDPAAAPRITSHDGRAGDAFEGCRRLFEGGKLVKADACFVRFVLHHGSDPLAVSARLYRGRAAISRGDLSAAKALLEPLARGLSAGSGQRGKTTRGAKETAPSPGPASGHEGKRAVARSARYYLGLTLARLGDHGRAIQLLDPLESVVEASSFPALATCLAASREALGQRVAACWILERLYKETDRPVERLHARLGLERMVLAAPAAQTKRLLAKASRAGLLRGLCARRLVTDAESRGDFVGAQVLRAQNAEALRHLGSVPAPRTFQRAGVLLPEGGPYRRVGEMAMVGLALASGAFSGSSKALDLVIRDSAISAAAAARGLITTDHVMALVGVFDPHRASAVARLATRARVPFLALAPGGPSGPWRLQLLPSTAARVTALVQHLLHEGARPRVLALVPDSRFGRRSLRVFAAVLRRSAGRLAGVERYRPGTTSFVRIGKRAARRSFDAIFVADSARRLALIAPALAQAGLWARPRGGAAPRGGRAYRLFATADGLSPRLLRSAGRYVQGAVLAPGFYPDPTSPRVGPLLRAFERAAGHAPSLVEAFAYDAIVSLRAALALGARSPAALRRSLGHLGPGGLTGTPRFDDLGRRVDPPALYEVRGAAIRLILGDRSSVRAAP